MQLLVNRNGGNGANDEETDLRSEGIAKTMIEVATRPIFMYRQP